jgi:hypothetical protein
MAAPNYIIPRGYRYSGFYPLAIFDALMALKKVLLPQHTETSLRDPLNAFLLELAYDGGRQSGTIDIVASEGYIGGAQRHASFAAMARLMGRTLGRDLPASVDVLMRLRSDVGATEVILPALASFTAAGDATHPATRFEYQGDDLVAGALDFTALVEDTPDTFGSQVDGDSIGTPWSSFAIGDAVYVGHEVLMPGGFKRTATSAWVAGQQVWEYYDGHYAQLQPGGVTDNSDGTLTLRLDDAIGTDVRRGLVVRVTSCETGRSVDVAVVPGGTDINEVTTPTYLGQASPSTDPSRYAVSAAWLPLELTLLSTAGLVRNYDLTLPQSESARWQSSEIGGVEAFWFRERVVVATTAVTGLAYEPLDTPTWWLMVACLQGQTVTDALGVSNGSTFQQLALNREPYIDGSLTTLTVGTDSNWAWAQTQYGAGPEDKSFEVLELFDGQIVVQFGDGTSGRVPPPALEISGTYRVGAGADGNVGVGLVSEGGPGTEFFDQIQNPRPASGWHAREAIDGDRDSINRARRDIPAGVRALDRIVTPEDCETMLAGNEPNGFKTADARRPFSRCFAYEFGAGWKTMAAVLVGSGGAVPESSDVAEAAVWLNGTETGLQRRGGRAPANQRIGAVAVDLVSIGGTIALTVLKGYERTAQAAARAALQANVDPLVQDGEGNYLWSPAMVVEADRLRAFLAGGVPGYFSSALPGFSDVTLLSNQLPVSGVWSITVLTAGA